jgi:2-keto-4-pentenoate hydratase
MTAGLDDPRIQAGMRRQFALFEERKRAGARRIGWKVGFGAPAAKEKLGLAGPLIGFLLDQAVLPDGATASLAGWIKPVAEPEIALEMAHELRAAASEFEVSRAIGAIGPAIELADLDIPADDVEAILAGNIFNRHVIFGPRRNVDLSEELSKLSGKVKRSGQDVSVPADLEANTGRLIEIVGHVSATLAAFDVELRAGDIIIAGSVTPPLILNSADSTLRWDLTSIGSVTLNFRA